MRLFSRCKFLGPSEEIRRLRTGMFLSWSFSIIIPIILIIAFNVMTYGTNAFKAITSPDYFNKQIYQLKELNEFEYLFKRLENMAISDPNIEEIQHLVDNIDYENSTSTSGRDQFENILLLVRKRNNIVINENFGTQLTENELASFDQLPKDILPKFQPGRETNNETLFHATGYVIARQQDFYFEDGEEGSLFYLRKYTNIPGKIASTIGRNLLYVLGMMFLIHTAMAFAMAKKFTQPISDMMTATDEVKNSNYDYRITSLDALKGSPLATLSNSLNEMIIELDHGKQYQDRIESMRSEFIANLSHDMKTPLTSIKIHAQAINDGIVNTPEKMDKYINNIMKKSNEMDAMLDELKVFNELELGTGNYVMHHINFQHFLEDAIEELHYDVIADRVELKVFTNVNTPIIEFDPIKFKRVLNNITFNSVKYAEVRPLIIEFKLEEEKSPVGNFLELTISDNGVGVGDDQYDKLFQQYYRVDPARNQTISGSGLGLSIAKSIIEHHGGIITAMKSELGGLAIKIRLKCEVTA